jgi:hypothetical protein
MIHRYLSSRGPLNFWYMSEFASCTTQIMTIDKDAGFRTGIIDVFFR